MPSFRIIQGGMGVGVSGWRLAQAVARTGQLGVVSGTGVAVVLARRLQRGDPGGHVRRALAQFPMPDVARRLVSAYFVPGGTPPDQPFKLTPMPNLESGTAFLELTVAANFVEVFLAKEGHTGPVGINFLEKLQLPALPSLFGAMLAGVDYVLMGAGVPRQIPGVLDRFAKGEAAELKIDVEGATADEPDLCRFDPAAVFGRDFPGLRRPGFFAIVSSATLAATLARKSNGQVDGFVIEGATAGGHNAPPRGPLQLTASGEPIYGPRDDIDLVKIRELALPFWLAGGYAHPDKLRAAIRAGARGIQVGTAFAFCEESGIDPALKQQVLQLCRSNQVGVYTNPAASPTGFPFKVVQLANSLSQNDVAVRRGRRPCDLGYLRQNYRKPDGSVGYRCPAEPVEHYVAKGGKSADTEGRLCVCNALFATIGLGQRQPSGETEPPLVTAGDDLPNLTRLLANGLSFSAADVIEDLLGRGPRHEEKKQEAAPVDHS